jgi:aspartyl-tRNA(Asn)/glutamyl-tRNA(Gln) amidotransferase subunit A
MQVVAGHDPLDPGSAEVPVPDFAAGLGRDVRGVRIGLPRHFIADAPGAAAEVVAALDAAAQQLAELGAEVEEVTLPAFALFNACGRVIMVAEAFAIHEQDLKRRGADYGRYTYQRMVPGGALSAADLVQAQRLRRELARAVNVEVLSRCDALLCAAGLAPAARFADFPLDWPPPAAATATQTIPWNVTGNPALAIPMGFSSSGLPLGMQIVGRAFDEPMVLRIGAAYAAATGLDERRRRPPVAA